LGGGLLALVADDVGQPGLDELGGLGVVVLGAGQLVGREDDRVGTGLLGVALDVGGVVVLAAVLDLGGGLEDLGGGLGARADPVLAHLDLRGGQLSDLRDVG